MEASWAHSRARSRRLFSASPDVAREVGLSPAPVKRLVAEGTFPKPIRLSERARRGRRAEVVAWVESCETADYA